MRNRLRQIDFSSVILQFAWGFLLSTVKSLICLRQLDADWVIILSAWGFFSYYVLKRYISWSDESSTTWFFRPPKALSRITYWRYTCFEAMECRRIDFSVRLRLFCVSRIEGIRIRRGMGVRGRRCAATWDWRWQNKKRSRMRLSSGSLRFSQRHRGALCAV